jgi:hypothetical protein
MTTPPGLEPALSPIQSPPSYSDEKLSELLTAHEDQIAHHEKAAAQIREHIENPQERTD